MNLSVEPIDSTRQQPPRGGLLLLQSLILVLFCLLALRLWYLQIHKGEQFASKARENIFRQESVFAPRGLIYDRDGVPVAFNEPAYAVGVVRQDVVDMDATLEQLARWTGQPIEHIRHVYQQGKSKTKPFSRQMLLSHLPYSTIARMESELHRWPGVEIVVKARRHYPQRDLLAHVLGYVAEASDAELDANPTLELGDIVGKQGIEYMLEANLRGAKGIRQIEVDAAGRRLDGTLLGSPAAGSDMRLSLDLDLQRLALEEMRSRGHSGAVVVMEPFTGQILAMASSPTFDNNAFTSGLSAKEWARLRDDPEHPLQNKAIQGVYPPGSVFKLVTAMAGLSTGVINPAEKVLSVGQREYGNRIFRDWRKGGHGWVDLHRALVQSCDEYFYEMGDRLGVDRIEAFSKAAGFGQKTGVDLPHERKGLIPSREWKRKRYGQKWVGGENLNLAIGQGYTLVSPLQVARFVSSLINGGYVLKPSLSAASAPQVQNRLPATQRHMQMVLKAMVDTVGWDSGTAKLLRRKDAVMGGKTGTAQIARLREEDRGRHTKTIRYEKRDHSWIASYGVKDGRSVVIVVLVEHGGHGAEAAVPVAAAMYGHIFGAPESGVQPLVRNWPYVAGRDVNPLLSAEAAPPPEQPAAPAAVAGAQARRAPLTETAPAPQSGG